MPEGSWGTLVGTAEPTDPWAAVPARFAVTKSIRDPWRPLVQPESAETNIAAKGRWLSSDFENGPRPPRGAYLLPARDPWRSVPDRTGVNSVATSHSPSRSTADQDKRLGATSFGLYALTASDPWSPTPRTTPNLVSPVDPWALSGELPSYDPHRRRFYAEPDGPRQRTPSSKAREIIAVLGVATPRERKRLTNEFELLFGEYPAPRLFQRLLGLAEKIDDGVHLLNAVELYQLWRERPDWQQVREQKYLTLLTLPKALTIVIARQDHDPEEMIDPYWLEDWWRLSRAEQGFYSFLDYVLHRIRDIWAPVWENEDDDDRAEQEIDRLVHDSSGMNVALRRGNPNVRSEIRERYETWRAKEEELLHEEAMQRARRRSFLSLQARPSTSSIAHPTVFPIVSMAEIDSWRLMPTEFPVPRQERAPTGLDGLACL